jgi:flagellar export protein FliJ
MARFVYRLQKVFELRERKKKQQEQRVLEAQTQVKLAEQALDAHFQKMAEVADFMRTAAPSFWANYDRFKEEQKGVEDQLRQNIALAKDYLHLQQQLLIKAQADVEALVKHRDKAKEEWMEEEKIRELRQMDEIGSQRYFRQQQAQLEEAAEIDAAALLALEAAELSNQQP